jgi:hypothetical protein
MLRLHSRVETPPVDTRNLLAALPMFLGLWRGLRFDPAVLDRDGRRREGLRVVAGSHPRPGTRYSVTMVARRPPEPTPSEREELSKLLRERHTDTDRAAREWFARRRETAEAAGRLETVLTTSTVEVVADDSHRVVVRTTHDNDGGVVIEAELARPARPERLTIDTTSNVRGNWLTRGKLKVQASCELDSLPSAHNSAPQFTGSLRHRHLRGWASIAISENDSGRWDVDVRIRVRGRRLTRPLFAVASLFLGRYTRRRFDKAVDRLPEKVERFNQDVRTRFGGMPSPQSIASDALDGLLADVAEHLPQV